MTGNATSTGSSRSPSFSTASKRVIVVGVGPLGPNEIIPRGVNFKSKSHEPLNSVSSTTTLPSRYWGARKMLLSMASANAVIVMFRQAQEKTGGPGGGPPPGDGGSGGLNWHPFSP